VDFLYAENGKCISPRVIALKLTISLRGNFKSERFNVAGLSQE
jgi:hypothetical protein